MTKLELFIEAVKHSDYYEGLEIIVDKRKCVCIYDLNSSTTAFLRLKCITLAEIMVGNCWIDFNFERNKCFLYVYV